MGGFFCSCGMGSENSTFLSFYISKAIKDRNYKDTPAAADARRKLFDQMDTDQSGEIDKKEAAKMWKCLKQALKELTKDGGIRKENSTISKAEFMEIYGKNDNLGNKNGLLEFEEFEGLLADICQKFSQYNL